MLIWASSWKKNLLYKICLPDFIKVHPRFSPAVFLSLSRSCKESHHQLDLFSLLTNGSVLQTQAAPWSHITRKNGAISFLSGEVRLGMCCYTANFKNLHRSSAGQEALEDGCLQEGAFLLQQYLSSWIPANHVFCHCNSKINIALSRYCCPKLGKIQQLKHRLENTPPITKYTIKFQKSYTTKAVNCIFFLWFAQQLAC